MITFVGMDILSTSPSGGGCSSSLVQGEGGGGGHVLRVYPTRSCREPGPPGRDALPFACTRGEAEGPGMGRNSVRGELTQRGGDLRRMGMNSPASDD